MASLFLQRRLYMENLKFASHGFYSTQISQSEAKFSESKHKSKQVIIRLSSKSYRTKIFNSFDFLEIRAPKHVVFHLVLFSPFIFEIFSFFIFISLPRRVFIEHFCFWVFSFPFCPFGLLSYWLLHCLSIYLFVDKLGCGPLKAS